MNLLPISFDPGVRQGYPSSEDNRAFHTAPAHLSPCPTSPCFNAPQSLVGLGISNCQTEPSCQRVYPTPETHPQPVTQWLDQVTMLDACNRPMLDAGTLIPEMGYETLQCFEPVPATFPNAYYYSGQAVSAPGYGGNCGVVPTQQPSMQEAVACPGDTSTPTTRTDEDLNRQFCFLGNTSTARASASMPQVTCPNPVIPFSFQFDNFQDSKPNIEWPTFQPQPAPVDQTSASDTTEIQPPQSNLSSASGLQCTICGYRFTRRSNCREHMKKHDPTCKKVHLCGICERPFGRRTDLNRHVGSVCHQISPYPRGS